MQIRKVNDMRFLERTYEDIPDRLVESMSDAVYVAPIHQDIHRKYPRTLTWDLGRRCNYSCSYCHPAISNTYEAHRTWGSLMFALEGIEKHFFAKGKLKAKFVFTGGEPTINPSYLDFVKLLTSKGHIVHTTTNGSRLPDYYAELLQHSFIGFSYHLEFAKIERFVKVLESIVEAKRHGKTARDNWCGIRIMVPPGRFTEAREMREAMLKVDGLKEMGIMIFMSPCYEKSLHTQMMPYDPEELRQISELT
jgi:MoaA/NifB/PqqE/SkfB family radical SAM enzyme